MAERRTLYPDPFPYLDYRRYTYSIGISTGDVVWIAGQLADRYDAHEGRMVCEGDLLEQTKLIYEKIRLTLASGGAGLNEIVHLVEYITPAARDAYPDTLGARMECFGDDLPPTTTVVVSQLLRPESLIEVEAVAAGGGSSIRTHAFRSSHAGGLTTPAAAQIGDLLFIAGRYGEEDKSGRIASSGDVAAQTTEIYDEIGRILEAAGATPSDIVRTIDYIIPAALPRYKETAAVRRDFFGDAFPASTGVIVEGMLKPGALLQVSAIALTNGRATERYNPGWSRYENLTFQPGVGKGDLLCLSGLTGTDPHTGSLVAGGLVAQTQRIFETAEAILAEAGMSMEDVVKTVDYITPEALPDYRHTVDVRKKVFGNNFPVATGVIVNRLLRPEYLIEIDFTAVAG